MAQGSAELHSSMAKDVLSDGTLIGAKDAHAVKAGAVLLLPAGEHLCTCPFALTPKLPNSRHMQFPNAR